MAFSVHFDIVRNDDDVAGRGGGCHCESCMITSFQMLLSTIVFITYFFQVMRRLRGMAGLCHCGLHCFRASS
jgi:hypothetical protein